MDDLEPFFQPFDPWEFGLWLEKGYYTIDYGWIILNEIFGKVHGVQWDVVWFCVYQGKAINVSVVAGCVADGGRVPRTVQFEQSETE